MKRIVYLVTLCSLIFSLNAQISIVDEHFNEEKLKKELVLIDYPYDSLNLIQSSYIKKCINCDDKLNALQNIVGQQIYIPKGMNISFYDSKLKRHPLKDIDHVIFKLKSYEYPLLLSMYPNAEIWTYIHNPDWKNIDGYSGFIKSFDEVGGKYYTIINFGIRNDYCTDPYTNKKYNSEFYIQKESEFTKMEKTDDVIELKTGERFNEISKYTDLKLTEDEEKEIKLDSNYWKWQLQETLISQSEQQRIQSVLLGKAENGKNEYESINIAVVDNITRDTLYIPFSESMVSVGFFVKAQQLLEGKTFVVSDCYEKTEQKDTSKPHLIQIDTSLVRNEFTDDLTKEQKKINLSGKWICEKIGLHPNGGSKIFAFLSCGNEKLSVEVKSLYPCEKDNLSLLKIGDFILLDDIDSYNKQQMESYYQNFQEEKTRRAKDYKAQNEIQSAFEKKYKQEHQLHLQAMINKYGSENGKKIANGQISIGFTKEMCIDAKGKGYSVIYQSTKFQVWSYYYYDLKLKFSNGILIEIFKNN